LIEAGFRPLVPDVPGFGESTYDGRGWNIRRVAAGMAALLEERAAHPADVVGLSMGGTIAQQLALDFPRLVRRLVLVSTFAVLRPESFGGWLYFLRRLVLVSILGLPAQARFVAGRIFPGPQNQPLRELLVASIARADPRAYRAAMRSLGLFNSLRRLSRIQAPTLVVTGDRDTTVSPQRQKLLAERIPGARQITIPDAGHAVAIDQPASFNRALLSFLSQDRIT
jgi:pimeloyl-ACP methyl ester carboxylesterase